MTVPAGRSGNREPAGTPRAPGLPAADAAVPEAGGGPAPALPPHPPPATGWRARLRAWARALKRDAIAILLALRDPRTPLLAKVTGFLTCAYAFSPIDLIPDFIPVLGQLDDLLLVPLGILLTRRLIPDRLWTEFRTQAEAVQDKPLFPGSLPVVLLTWLLAVALCAWVAARFW
ncbi:MAG: DUF1232 domain-containing protein [Candidatus Riflebacteria bacterium]|nr:DUF1232 domain-containing protein [Candidatus Riflebacteria bacterium]